MRLRLVATGLLLCAACSHAPPSEAAKVERRDDWLFALRSDLERIASNDGFQGQVRVMPAGKPEIDLSSTTPPASRWAQAGGCWRPSRWACSSTRGSSAGTTDSSGGCPPPREPPSLASPWPIF